MEALLAKIGQLAIFLICAQTLIHFRPKDSYEKYIKLLVSMMLLILLVEPVMDLLGKGDQGDFLENVHIYEQELQGILVTPQLENSEIEQILQNITLQKVEESYSYMQSEPADTEASGGEQQVSGRAIESDGALRTQEDGEQIKVNVEIEMIEKIEEIEIGAAYGKSAENP